MNYVFSLIFLSTLLTGCILCTGCNSYAEPEIQVQPELHQVNISEADKTITYDVTVDVTNTGQNNAYDVMVMVIVSTPEDLPEYRLVNDNIDVGTVSKKETVSFTRRLTLPMTQSNFDILSKGEREAVVNAKVTRMSSNIMG